MPGRSEGGTEIFGSFGREFFERGFLQPIRKRKIKTAPDIFLPPPPPWRSLSSLSHGGARCELILFSSYLFVRFFLKTFPIYSSYTRKISIYRIYRIRVTLKVMMKSLVDDTVVRLSALFLTSDPAGVTLSRRTP